MRKLFFIIPAVLIIIVVAVLALKPAKQGKILGTSINSFYSEKSAKLDPYPIRKQDAKDPYILAEAAVLLRASDKYPLYQKNQDNPVPIASITKVMTSLVALDIYKLDDVIEVKKEYTDVIGSKVQLKPGEKMTVSNLLRCLLISSGNDAAKTLANGKVTENEFVQLMNQKAIDLGLRNTHFKDVAGLDDSGRSTAKDVAVLFSYGLSNPEFAKIVSTAELDVPSVDGKEIHKLKNSNRLVTGEIFLEGIIGGKTGFTPDAGHTLVSAATRDGQTLVAVVLKTNSDSKLASAQETKKLLDWGFESYIFK